MVTAASFGYPVITRVTGRDERIERRCDWKGCAEREGGGVLHRKYVLDLMHGRSGMTIDPPIPTMPGRSMSRFHRPGRHCLHQARSAVRCPASRMKGELHPTKNRL